MGLVRKISIGPTVWMVLKLDSIDITLRNIAKFAKQKIFYIKLLNI